MLRNKMLAVISELNGFIAERMEVIECLAIALLTFMNLFILGDTGQGKTYAINEFRRRIIGATPFECTLTKQTDQDALFGRIDLATMMPGNPDERVLKDDSYYQELLHQLRDLTSNNPDDCDNIDMLTKKLEVHRKALYMLYGNKPRLNTTGYLPESHIVFLDEFFKCGEGTLNSLLTAINERKYYNEGEVLDVLAMSFIAASNKSEVPNFNDPSGSIFRPLFDRFELKVVTEYIKDRDELLRVMSHNQQRLGEQINATISLEELRDMQDEVASVTVPEQINKLIIEVCCELRGHDIHISDRKITNCYPALQAKAWLSGRDIVQESDLVVMKHCLWEKEEDIPTIQQVLDKFCRNPLQAKLEEIISMADEIYADFIANVDTNPIKRMNKLLEELKDIRNMLLKLDAATSDTEGKAAIAEAFDDLEDISKKAHKKCKHPYVPLSKIYRSA